MRGEITRVLFDEEQIARRVKALGEQITADYQGREIFAICLLKGSMVFTSDLIRQIKVPIRVDMMRASSYEGGTESKGSVKVIYDLDCDISELDVLVIEDIVDTGRTLNRILNLLKVRGPRSIKVCSFLDKPSRRVAPVEIGYTGFVIEDDFVIGYGLDVAEKYRELPYIGIFKPE